MLNRNVFAFVGLFHPPPNSLPSGDYSLTTESNNPTLRDLPERNENVFTLKMYVNGFSNFINNHPNLEISHILKKAKPERQNTSVFAGTGDGGRGLPQRARGGFEV